MLECRGEDREVNRRGIWEVLTALGLLPVAGALGACQGSQAAPAPAPTEGITPTVPAPYQIRVQVRPQDATLGRDENVVVQASFLTREGRPVTGAQLSAVANYPTGPKTFTSEITTFPDGRAGDLLIPVAPATRGSNVRLDVVMRYQGQEYHQAAGFNVR